MAITAWKQWDEGYFVRAIKLYCWGRRTETSYRLSVQVKDHYDIAICASGTLEYRQKSNPLLNQHHSNLTTKCEGKSQKELNIKLILVHPTSSSTPSYSSDKPTSDPTSPPTQTPGESGGTWPKWPVLPASNKGFSAAKHKRLTYGKGPHLVKLLWCFFPGWVRCLHWAWNHPMSQQKLEEFKEVLIYKGQIS